MKKSKTNGVAQTLVLTQTNDKTEKDHESILRLIKLIDKAFISGAKKIKKPLK